MHPAKAAGQLRRRALNASGHARARADCVNGCWPFPNPHFVTTYPKDNPASACNPHFVTTCAPAPACRVLTERNFPYSDIKMLASARSAGRKYTFEGVEYTVEELTEKRWVLAGNSRVLTPWKVGSALEGADREEVGAGRPGMACPWAFERVARRPPWLRAPAVARER